MGAKEMDEKTQIMPNSEEKAVVEMIIAGEYKRLLVIGISEENEFFIKNFTGIESDAYGLIEMAQEQLDYERFKKRDLGDDD